MGSDGVYDSIIIGYLILEKRARLILINLLNEIKACIRIFQINCHCHLYND